MRNFCKRLWCGVFGHVFSSVVELGKIRLTKRHYLFSSEGYQTGIRRCLICQSRVNAYRKGWFGFGGPSSPIQLGPWRSLDGDAKRTIEECQEVEFGSVSVLSVKPSKRVKRSSRGKR